MLVDLTAAVAEALNRPFHALSMEMIYRGLYHSTVARHRGKADYATNWKLGAAFDKLSLRARPQRPRWLSLSKPTNAG